MKQIVQCPRCHETFFMSRYPRMGVCRWCEEDLVALDRELSRECGLRPMTKQNIEELNKYWREKKA
jgi:hypothetical protein